MSFMAPIRYLLTADIAIQSGNEAKVAELQRLLEEKGVTTQINVDHLTATSSGDHPDSEEFDVLVNAIVNVSQGDYDIQNRR